MNNETMKRLCLSMGLGMIILTGLLIVSVFDNFDTKMEYLEKKERYTLEYIKVKMEREEAREMVWTLERELAIIKKEDDSYFSLMERLEIEKAKRLNDVVKAEADLVKITAQVALEQKMAEASFAEAKALQNKPLPKLPLYPVEVIKDKLK